MRTTIYHLNTHKLFTNVAIMEKMVKCQETLEVGDGIHDRVLLERVRKEAQFWKILANHVEHSAKHALQQHVLQVVVVIHHFHVRLATFVLQKNGERRNQTL